MECTLRTFELPLARPLDTAAGAIETRRGVAIRVRDASGVGVGEATPLAGWTESYADCRAALTAVADADDPALSLPSESVPSLPSESVPLLADERLRTCPAARHGLSLAIADHSARVAGIPLYRHLGGEESVRRVRANATIGDADVPTTVVAAADAIDAGFTSLKLKVGARPVEDDVERLGRVRDAVGPAVELRADANGAWSREQARRAFDGFASLDVAYVEQPLPADDVSGHAALCDSSVGVALDEALTGRSVDELEACFAVADVVIVKPMALGGVDRAIDVARRALAAGLVPVVTTTVDAVVARTAAVHVAAALPDRPACGLATASLLARDLSRDPAPVDDGSIRVPQSPGIGTLGPWGVPAGEVTDR